MSIKGRMGFYTITPQGDFAATAKAVGAALGVNLIRDISGNYEEFPAFVGLGHGLHLALLGSANPKDHVRENPTGNFELQVHVVEERAGHESPEKINEFILGTLHAQNVVSTVNGWGT